MSNRIRSFCPSCQQVLKVAEEHIGRRIRCPKCQHRFTLQTSQPAAQSPQSLDRAVSLESSMSDSSSRDVSRSDEASTTTRRVSRIPSIRTLGRFELKEKVGQGGFGEVFRAYDPQLDRVIALKVPKFGPQDKKKIRRFLTEARAAASLHHPNIIAVYERGQIDNDYYIASEFVEGETLAQHIKQNKVSNRRAVAWVRDLANALAYAHSEHVIHRDIKPDNVMLGKNHRPQIMDFGLAKKLDEDSSMTADGGILGTPAYMSPEQARGETETVGSQSDQYSLGVVLYELLTGAKPFNGPPHVVVPQVALEEPPTPQSIDSTIPNDLQAICLKAMSKNIAHRYSDLSRMAEDLDRWLEGHEILARPIGRLERFIRWYRRNKLVANLGAAFFLVLLAGGIVSSYFAVVANRERAVAEVARNDAVTAQEKAEAQSRLAKRRLAESQYNAATDLSQKGRHYNALAMLAHCESNTSEDDNAFRNAIRLKAAALWDSAQTDQFREFLHHDDGVIASDYALDGSKVATGSLDGIAIVWDPKTGLILSPKIPFSGNQDSIKGGNHEGSMLCLSADATKLLTTTNDGAVDIRDIKSGDLLGQLLADDKIVSVARSYDGARYATGTETGHVHLWDSKTLKQIGELQLAEGMQRYHIRQIEFSPDDKIIATSPLYGDAPRFNRLWDTQTLKPLEHQPSQQFKYPNIAFSADSRFFIVAHNRYGLVHIWDILDGKEVVKPPHHLPQVRGLAFDPTGKWYTTLDRHNGIDFWNAETGERLRPTLDQYRTPYHTLSLSPDGKHLLIGDTMGHVRIWNVDTLLDLNEANSTPAVSTKPRTNSIKTACFSPTGRFLAVATHTRVQLWDASKQTLLAEYPEYKHNLSEEGLLFSPDERYLLVSFPDETHILSTESLPSGDSGYEPVSVLNHQHGTYSASFSSDNKHLALSGRSGQVWVWELPTGQEVIKPLPHPYRVWSVCFRPGLNELFSIVANGEVRRWNVETGTEIGEPQILTEQIHWPVGFSKNVDQLFMGESGQQKTNLWKWSGDKWTKTFTIPDQHIKETRIYFSDDAQLLFVGDTNSFKVWDVVNQTQVGRTVRHPDPVKTAKWANSQNHFVLTISDSLLRLWDIHSGKQIFPATPIKSYSWANINQNGTMIAFQSPQGEITFRRIPKPFDGNFNTVKLSVEVATGQELTDDGEFRYMSSETWYESVKKLNQLKQQSAAIPN